MNDEKQTQLISAMTAEEVRKNTKISEDFYTVFSNHVRVTASRIDFRLFFGESYPTATNEVRIIEQFNVALTPVQAKALLKLLEQVIQNVEAAGGTIPTIESLQWPQAPQTPELPGKPPE